MKIRNIVPVVAAAAVIGTAGGAVAAASGPAQAGTQPVYSTSVKTVYVYSPKCLHTHTRTVRYYGYSSKAGRYVPLARASVTVSDSYRCHS